MKNRADGLILLTQWQSDILISSVHVNEVKIRKRLLPAELVRFFKPQGKKKKKLHL